MVLRLPSRATFVLCRPAEDALRNAPHPSQDRRGRFRQSRRYHDAGRSGRGGRSGREPAEQEGRRESGGLVFFSLPVLTGRGWRAVRREPGEAARSPPPSVRPRESGDPAVTHNWIPAFAGMNGVCCARVTSQQSSLLRLESRPRRHLVPAAMRQIVDALGARHFAARAFVVREHRQRLDIVFVDRL